MSVIRGVQWTAAARYCNITTQFLTAMVLARVLAPADYGLIAMAWIVVGFGNLLRNFGVAQAIIQRESVDDDLLSSVFYLNVAVAAALMLLLASLTPLIEWAYGVRQVGVLVIALSSTYVFSSLSMIPTVLLMRDMEFGKVSCVQIASTLCGGVVAIVCAFAGWGVWSLATGSICGELLSPVLYRYVHPWRPKLHFGWSDVRSVLSFGANLTGFNIFNYFSRKADDVIVGRFLGASALGYYGFAYRFLLLPKEAIAGLLGTVVFPKYSRMQHDDERLAAAHLRVCSGVALVSFPTMLGLMVIAEPFIVTVVGAKWLPAVPVMMILCPLGALQSLLTISGQLYLCKGKTNLLLRWSLITGICTIGSFFAGLPWGIVGVAAAYAACWAMLALPGLWIPFSLVEGLTVRALLSTIRPYAVSAAVMAAAVLAVRRGLENAGAAQWVILIVSVASGVAIYCGLILRLRPPAMYDFLQLLPERWSGLFSGRSVAEVRPIPATAADGRDAPVYGPHASNVAAVSARIIAVPERPVSTNAIGRGATSR